MNAIPLKLADLLCLAPFSILIFGALLLLVAVRKGKDPEPSMFFAICSVGIVLAAGLAFLLPMNVSAPLREMLVLDRLGLGFSWIVILLMALVLPVLSTNTPTVRTGPVGVYALILLSGAGALFMIAANHLLVFFIGLELLSLPLYVMSGFGYEGREGSEASFKYFLLGAFSSALFVYGMALLWGATGTLTISEMPRVFAEEGVASSSLVLAGSTLMLAGIAFKIGLVPFQMWMPDVYEGAPSAVVGWMSGAVKAASFAAALRLFGRAIPTTNVNWPAILSILAMASMVWGSFAALYQTNVKRLLAYSSIAHAGYALIAVVCSAEGATQEAISALVFYILVYGLASYVSFVILSIDEARGHTSIEHLAGLAKRKPAMALALAVSLLSLAGLPPLGGFVGKFNVFILAMQKGHTELVLVGVITSLVSLGYYLRIIVSAYMAEPTDPQPVLFVRGMGWTLGGTCIVLVLLGMFPARILEYFLQVGRLIP